MGEPKGETYTVKPGDTLYTIALEHGLDYRELAIWNGIDNPGALRVGQQLRVTPPPSAVVTAPLKTPGSTVQAKPLAGPTGPSPVAVPAPPSSPPLLVSEPKGERVPYSEQALAQLSKPQAAAPASVGPPRSEPRPEVARAEPGGDTARGPDDLDWAWPARG